MAAGGRPSREYLSVDPAMLGHNSAETDGPSFSRYHVDMESVPDSGPALVQELPALVATGELLRERDGSSAQCDLSMPGEGVLWYSQETYPKVGDWLQRAYTRACRDAPGLAADLAEVVREWTGLPPLLAAGRMGLALFLVEEDPSPALVRVRDAEGNPIGWRASWQDADGIDIREGGLYADPLDARYRFQAMLRELHAVTHLGGSALAGTPTLLPEYCTVSDLAKLEGVKPNRVQQWVSEHRTAHGGKDPAWVRRRPGQQRGFTVNVKSYYQLKRPLRR